MSELIASYIDNTPRVIRRTTWPSQRETFISSIRDCEAFLAAGSIPNARFKDHKHVVNHGLELAARALWSKYTFHDISFFEEPIQKFINRIGLYDVTLNTIPNRHKDAVAFIKLTRKVHPYQTEMLAFLTAALPLSDMFKKLSGMAFKREVKPVEDRKPGYHPPVCSTEGQKAVVALLESVTQKKYDELKNILLNQTKSNLNLFLNRPDKKVSPSRFFNNHNAIIETEKLVDFGRDFSVVPDHEEIIDRMATETADYYRTAFVHKNFVKIASIIDHKNVPYEVTVVETSVSLTALTGRFIFLFKDGSRFTVMNQVVNVVNAYGLQFLKFPLTFHDVFFSNGEKLSKPSEEIMNKVFVNG